MSMTILDGGMGTMLQAAGMKPGERTEVFGINNPDKIISVHKQYIESGSRVIYANTFGANAKKLAGTGHDVREVVMTNVRIALQAAKRIGSDGRVIPHSNGMVRVALDIGPIGQLMEPLGMMSFDEAYDLFLEMLKAGEEAGADLVIFETMSDLGEIRAGVLAAIENTSLPVWTTMSFENNGRSFSGTSVEAFAMTMDSLPVEALGINCSLGPDGILPFIKEMRKWTDKPLIVKPNAGLPDPVTGGYDLDAAEFAGQMRLFEGTGTAYIGGCCGTTPDFIRELAALNLDADSKAGNAASFGGACSSSKVVSFDGIRVVGERINPTGKKRFQQALKERDFNYIMKCAIEQQEAGADILDINVGIPGIDEPEMMREVVKAVQSVTDLPLQIDSSDPAAIEAGLRAANGRSIVNSVNAEDEKLDTILPIVKKYGASVVALTMDRSGIPESADARFALAQKMLARAIEAGIPKENVIIDCLALTISSMQAQAAETLKAIRMVSEELGLHCTLGVSNISFGLPARNHVTSAFLSQAINSGLDLPIINPNIAEIMDVVTACRALSCEDRDCVRYIDRFAAVQGGASAAPDRAEHMTLEDAVLKGLGDEVEAAVTDLLASMSEMDVINDKLIPALDIVGIKYEKGEIYLPQLISAANAASSGFEVIKKRIAGNGGQDTSKGTIILATVEGDIHDIGKNIVKVVLENYGYRIIDLGKDVPPEKVVETAISENVRLVGLSALMTTTVEAMERTIKSLRESGHECQVFVGGAVLTAEYAKNIGADFYAKDAKESADIAKKIFG